MNPLPGVPTVTSSAAPASATAVTVGAASSAVSAVIGPTADVSLSSGEALPHPSFAVPPITPIVLVATNVYFNSA